MGRSVATSVGIFGSNNPSRGHQRAGVKTFFLIKQQKHRQSTALAEPIRTRWLMSACAHFFRMVSVSQNFIFLLWSAVKDTPSCALFGAVSGTHPTACKRPSGRPRRGAAKPQSKAPRPNRPPGKKMHASPDRGGREASNGPLYVVGVLELRFQAPERT